MKSKLTKFALAATLGLAMTFTFSCSSGGGSGEGSGFGHSGGSGGGGDVGGGGGGGVGNLNPQVYHEDGSIYTGSGVIKLKKLLMDAGSIKDGKVNLQLPTIPDENLRILMDEGKQQSNGCTEYTSGLKVWMYDDDHSGLLLADNNYTLKFEDDSRGMMIFWYFSKAGKINCYSKREYDDGDTRIDNITINAQAGWNKIFVKKSAKDSNPYTVQYTTNNILTTQAKWIIEDDR